MDNPYGLERFVEAQRTCYESVKAELRAGRKQSHWIWFIFPQVRGLGQSSTSMRYAVGSLGEARAYLAHPVLGPRLLESTELALSSPARSAEEIFGALDGMKFRSSMTLFAAAAEDQAKQPFQAALDRFFRGVPDPRTLDLLA